MLKRALLSEAFLLAIGLGLGFSFPLLFCLKPLDALQSWFFYLGSFLGRMLTLDNLKRRGRALANRRFLCGEGEETIDHLLIHCSKIKILWELLLVIFGVSWVFSLCERDSSFLESFFCGKTSQNDLDDSPP